MLRRLLLCSLLSCAVLAPSAHAGEPGLNLAGNFFVDEQQYDAVQRSGAKWVRVFVFVDQTTPGILTAYRKAADRYRSTGVKTEAVLLAAADSPLRHDPSAFASAAANVASAIGPGLHAVEIWNEPDAEAFWAGGADPAAYAALLKAGHAAVKKARPDVSVLIGGLTGNNAAFLEQLLREDVGGAFDAVGVHSDTACNLRSPYDYQKDNEGVLTFSSFVGYRELIRVLDAKGLSSKKIWFTEIGWSSSGRTCDQGVFAGQKNGGVTEAEQALFLKQGYHCIAIEDRIGPSFWFNLKDGTVEDTVDGRYGLLRASGAEKPSFGAFTDVATHGDKLTEPCGSFGGPSISLSALGDAKGKNKVTARYAKQLRVAGTATDPDVVGRVSLFLDGVKIRNFTAPKGATLPFSISIDKAKKLKTGRHRLTVQAKDMKGNVTAQSFDVTKVADKKKKK